MDRDDQLAPFSNYTLDSRRLVVFAPGVDLYGPLGAEFEDSRAYWSGTSFSAGLISGAAALARSVDPHLSAWGIMTRLRWSVDPILSPNGENPPFGRINLRRVVRR